MKKIVLLLLFLLLASAIFASSNRTYFPSLGKDAVYPVDSKHGQVVPSNTSEGHLIVYKALTEEFNFEWTEKFLHPDVKKNLSAVYSDELSTLLPSHEIILFKERANSDTSVSITSRLLDKDKTITFAIREGKISAIQIK